MKIVRPSKKTIRGKKIKHGSRSTLDKIHINEKLSEFMLNVDNIIINDRIKIPVTKTLITYGIKPDNITTIIGGISRKIDSPANIVFGNIDEYIDKLPIQKIGGMYFIFQDGGTLDMFKKSILAMGNHITPYILKIAITFYTDDISEPAIYNACLDIMESMGYSIIFQCSYAYSFRREIIMHHQQFTLQKNV
jgi:hypothetical protein